MNMQGTLKAIKPIDRKLEKDIQHHLDDLTKPRGSLGRLEEIALQYCLIRNTSSPSQPKKKIFCMAADHGVAQTGVSAYPQEVTGQMALNMLAGGAAINALASHAGAELSVIDIGVATDISGNGLIDKKIKRGTDNMTKGPAMTTSEAIQAIETGIKLAGEAKQQGFELLGTGDMGIANTTASTALYCSYLDIKAEEITGLGTGISQEQLRKKVSVINKSLEVNRKIMTDPLNILAAVGGLEIAAICGVCIGAAANALPVVVDGFISTAGAVAAIQINPEIRDYMFFSHLSREKGHDIILQKLNAKPLLDLNLRLGEGTGAALAMTLIDASIKIYNEMATFSSASISDKD